MAKILVQVPQGVGPLQVEVPEYKLDGKGRPLMERPLGADGKPAKDGKGRPVALQSVPFGERSCDGALHLRPGASKVITEAEFQHIKKMHPDVGRRLHVVKQLTDEDLAKGKGKGESKAAEATPEAPAPSASASSGDAPEGSEGYKPKKSKGK